MNIYSAPPHKNLISPHGNELKIFKKSLQVAIVYKFTSSSDSELFFFNFWCRDWLAITSTNVD